MKQSFKSKETVLAYILDKGNPALLLKYISTKNCYKYSSACRELLANNSSWLMTEDTQTMACKVHPWFMSGQQQLMQNGLITVTYFVAYPQSFI